MDRERALALKHLYWDEVCKEIDEKINKVLNELRFTTPDKLPILQERIRTLEEVKGLPNQVIEQKGPIEEG